MLNKNKMPFTLEIIHPIVNSMHAEYILLTDLLTSNGGPPWGYWQPTLGPLYWHNGAKFIMKFHSQPSQGEHCYKINLLSKSENENKKRKLIQDWFSTKFINYLDDCNNFWNHCQMASSILCTFRFHEIFVISSIANLFWTETAY